MSNTAPNSVTRQLLHTRQISCQGFSRSDGLYDIEGRLEDLTDEPTDLPFHRVAHGSHIHDMRLRMTIDADMVIHSIEALTASAASPFCAEVTPAYAQLKGLTIGPGFLKKVRAFVGGELGCTHLTELLERMAKTAMQTMFSTYRAEASRRAARGESRVPAVRPWVIGTCHAYREDGDAVRLLWPKGFPAATPS